MHRCLSRHELTFQHIFLIQILLKMAFIRVKITQNAHNCALWALDLGAVPQTVPQLRIVTDLLMHGRLNVPPD